MRRDIEIAAGDICGDATGLRVRVEEVDLYDYVHFSVVEKSESEEDGRLERCRTLLSFADLQKWDHTFAENGRSCPPDQFAHLGARGEISVGNVLDVAEFVGDRGWKTFLQTLRQPLLQL